MLVIFFGWTLLNRSAQPEGTVDLPHIHGLGFSSDGGQLIVPAHDGLRIYSDNGWQIPEGPRHDYMGYSPVDEGFYSSGHPAAGSGLVNPFGLVKSVDGGQTMIPLGFEGESDFHLMGVGYFNHAIYIFNPSPNSELLAGIFYSLDDGRSWQRCTMQGVFGQPFQLAVHPREAHVVALASENGLYLSADFGDTFTRISQPEPVTAAVFAPDGQRLLFGATELAAYDLETNQITSFVTPALGAADAISYIAVSQVQPNEIAFTTRETDVYLSMNGGAAWRQIAAEGVGGP